MLPKEKHGKLLALCLERRGEDNVSGSGLVP